ncbi:hypothetical protein [Prauserella endophytica]|uniref:Tail assembly chaperone n=1 Tax=Prauserella endophytica TaxID=1592324 RepID=A0ABY2RSU3_9PSEU|nr:hypothetical protein [Prauserella endophytica]TKG58899.1 hypothetical protein FCN18_37435 [Prauserella endophytica]
MADDTQQKEALANAHMSLVLAKAAHAEGSDELREAERKYEEAKQQVEACYEPLTLVALPPEDYEALIAAHPPTAEQKKQDPEVTWNEDTFRPALLSVTVEGDVTEQDWAEMYKTGQINIGEFRELVYACLLVNNRATDPLLGKG